MNGLAKHTEKIFEQISMLDCIGDYTLMGGTALSLQLHHRLSEDLDFCRWHKTKNEKLEVNWHVIKQELDSVGQTQVTLVDKTQCDFIVEGIRITFLDDNKFKEPEQLQKIPFLNNLKIADVVTLGIMKMEVMSRRSVYRDYYDMYAILQNGVPLSSIISGTGKYTSHNLRTRDMLSILFNAEESAGDMDSIVKMNPVYHISFQEMKQAIIALAKDFVK
jgi:predicted nucleotidyltransferase component of viral defense system